MKMVKKLISIVSLIAMLSSFGCVKAEDYSANTGLIDLSKMTVTGEGIKVEASNINITKGGDFTVTGSNENVMIYVNTEDRVKLRLSGMSIKNEKNPAIFFENTDKGFITLTEGTENYISDGTEYQVEAKAAIFSNDDLEIKGNGVLNIEGNYKHAIASDDDIKLENGKVNILSAVSDGIHANGDVEVADGNITVTAKSDGIQAETNFIIDAGTINILESEEGIESGGSMTLNGGEINISASDDGLNSGGGLGNGNEMMPGMGEFGGRGQRPPKQGENGEMMTPPPMPGENGEMPMMPGERPQGGRGGRGQRMPIQGENGEMMTPPPMPEENGKMPQQNGERPANGNMPMMRPEKAEQSRENTGAAEDTPSDTNIYLNGTKVTIDALGDGIDANGNIIMNGGEIYVSGSENGGNGAIDCYSFDVSGGVIFATGNSGMAMGVNSGSEQCAFNVAMDKVMDKGSLVEIKNADNEVILEYTLKKSANSVVFSSPDLKEGEKYTVLCDGETVKEIEMTSKQVSEVRGFGGMGGGNRGGNRAQIQWIKITE